MKKQRYVRVNPKAVGHPRKIGAAAGYGPRHAENAKEGEDLTQVNTDSVPAMLTPREAVLNRNAAELAGRGEIEALNEKGNELAKKGVDLPALRSGKREVEAAGGDSDVGLSEILKTYQAGGNLTPEEIAAVVAMLRGGGAGQNLTEAPLDIKAYEAQRAQRQELPNPNREQRGTSDMKSKQKVKGYEGGTGGVGGPVGWRNVNRYGVEYGWNPGVKPSGGMAGAGQPMGGGMGSDVGYRGPGAGMGSGVPASAGVPGAQAPGIPGQKVNQWGTPYGWNPNQASGSFYPPGTKGIGLAGGSEDVTPPIGAPNPQTAYGPPIQLTAPQLQQAAVKAGLSPGQLQGLMAAVQGFGQGYNELTGGAGSASDMATAATGSYQGGISDIGYPPFLMPNAEYHADKGSTWEGAYDPNYLVQRYARGTGDVPGYRRGNPDMPFDPGAWADPGDLGFNTGPGGFGRPSTMAEGGGGNSGYVNRSSWQGGAPGFPWSPTAIPTTYNSQGYPFAVPVQGPDQNLQGVGRTHNLRKNQ